MADVLKTGVVYQINLRAFTPEGTLAAAEKLLPIYQRYYALGGRYVSLGSDAHTAQNIGMNFQVALELAEAAKLQPVTFTQRKMQLCKY